MRIIIDCDQTGSPSVTYGDNQQLSFAEDGGAAAGSDAASSSTTATADMDAGCPPAWLLAAVRAAEASLVDPGHANGKVEDAGSGPTG